MTQTLEQLSAAATEGEYDKQVQLWFFRELTSDQRLALFKLCGLPVDEIGHTHSHQRLCLKRVLRRTGQLVAVQPDDATVERVKDAIGTSLAYDIGMDVRAGSLTDDEKRKVARKAIAAMIDKEATMEGVGG